MKSKSNTKKTNKTNSKPTKKNNTKTAQKAKAAETSKKAKLPVWATILIIVLSLALALVAVYLVGQTLGWYSFKADAPFTSTAKTSSATSSNTSAVADKADKVVSSSSSNGSSSNNNSNPPPSGHGDFGTKGIFISPDASASSGLPVGFWLLEVLESRAAYQAGIRRNDVVLQLDEVEAIRNYGNDIIAYRDTLQIGDVIRVEYWDYDTHEIRSVEVECTPSDGLYWTNEQSVIDAIFPPNSGGDSSQTGDPAPTEAPFVTGVQMVISDITKIYPTPNWGSRYTITDLVTMNSNWAAVGISNNPSQVAGSNGELTLDNQSNNAYYITFNGTKSFDLVTFVGERREETHWNVNLVRDDMIRAFNEEWGWGLRIYRGSDRNLYLTYYSSEYEGKDITDFVVFVSGME